MPPVAVNGYLPLTSLAENSFLIFSYRTAEEEEQPSAMTEIQIKWD